MDKKKISIAVVRRLPRYYRILSDLMSHDVERISSQDLSKIMGTTASQVRQDLNNFGGFGQQGYGYNVSYLQKEIGKILGLGHLYSLIVVGAGNLGRAICNHQNFERRGFHIVAMFDSNPQICGTKVNNIPVYPMERLEPFIERYPVEIAALCIPSANAPQIAKVLADKGIKGIWNFSSTELHLDVSVKVENVHLTESLMTLSYALQADMPDDEE